AALERPRLAEPQVERSQVRLGEAVGDALGQGRVYVTQKSHRQVEVGGGRPAKLGSARGAVPEVCVEHLALGFGQRQPKKSPDVYRRGFFAQLTGPQERGAGGLRPDRGRAGRIPAARFAAGTSLTSAGGTRRLGEVASRPAAG